MEWIADDLVQCWNSNRELVKWTLKREIAHNLLSGSAQLEEASLQDWLAMAGIKVLPNVVMVFRTGGAGCRQSATEQRNKLFRKLEGMLRLGQEALITIMGQDNILAALVGESDTALLLPVSGISRQDDAVAVTKRYAKYLKTYLERELGEPIMVGIGSVCNDFSQLPDSYAEARTAVVFGFYENNGAVLHIRDIQVLRRQGRCPDFIRYETLLLDSLRRGDWDEFYRTSRALITDIAQNRLLPDVLRVRMLEMLTLLSRVVVDMGGDPDKLLALKVKQGDEICRVTTVAELKGWIEDAFRDIAWLVQGKQQDITAKAIHKAKQYIHANYARNISLEELAQQVLLSPHYLSHVFSETCGESITEYLKKIRLNRAQAMLRTSEKSVAEIAASVGYADPNYFTRVFKSLTGKSPHQYRKGI